jgi:hypothetical protein
MLIKYLTEAIRHAAVYRQKGLKGRAWENYFVSTVASYNLFSNVYDIFCVCLCRYLLNIFLKTETKNIYLFQCIVVTVNILDIE